MIQAGILREVIDIEQPVLQQDELGQRSPSFELLYENVRAAIVPLSGREYVAAKQVAAEITTRITIRRLPGIVPTCRVLRTLVGEDVTEVYDILAVLPDPVSGQRYLTLMCVQRTAEGFRRGR